VSYEEIEQLHL